MAESVHDPVPPIRPRLLGWFRWFVRGYLKRHFHSIAVNRRLLKLADIQSHDAFVVYANHASWWDPLVAIELSDKLFPGFAMFAPIDASALAKYPMFGRMGFFAVEPQSQSGARDFLRISTAVVGRASASLWVTPEGRFADVRDSSAELMPGLSHLAWKLAREAADDLGVELQMVRKSRQIWYLPVAIEYPFWEERRPELLVWFGAPMNTAALIGKSKAECLRVLTHHLREAQRELAEASIARDGTKFELLGGGPSGTFFVYDWWRSLRGAVRGKSVKTDHGTKLNNL